MARHIEGPWFRKGKNTWYITQDGRNISLGVRGKGNRKEAVSAWHKLIKDGPKAKPEPSQMGNTVPEAVEGFLAGAAARTKASTHGLYKRHLDRLAADLGKKGPGRGIERLYARQVASGAGRRQHHPGHHPSLRVRLPGVVRQAGARTEEPGADDHEAEGQQPGGRGGHLGGRSCQAPRTCNPPVPERALGPPCHRRPAGRR
ncbi:MAG: hypothetical protein JWO38_264 [Gemmataceae bacterium]|nr:hypothetical protein [Gemmataceae bacterium]